MANPDCYVLREVSVNGTRTESRSYTAADQVVGWTYDAAGNLLNDGTTTSAYDALGRLTSTTHGGTTTTRSYNGDGVLIAQSSGNTTTRSTQDLVAPLSQILQRQQGTQRTDYVYGHERLLALEGTAQTWYGSDALGSVRQTLSSSGAALSKLNYDPWGMPQGGATPPTFGFAGELQDATSGLVYLRARWYQPQHGRFLSRDPFAGFPTLPYSQHPYQYAYADPVLLTDPSGQSIPRFFKQGENINILGFIVARLTQEDYDWAWKHGSMFNLEDGAAYADAIIKPVEKYGYGFYVLMTDREVQQRFTARYRGPMAQNRLVWDMAQGVGQEIYHTGSDLYNGLHCENPNQFGRGLSRFALSLIGIIITKLGIKRIARLATVGESTPASKIGVRWGPHTGT